MKSTFFVVLAILCTFSSKAQSAFSQSDKVLSINLGLGSPYWGSGYKASLPVNPTISFEKGVAENISAGGFVSYSSSSYDYSYTGYSYKIKYTGIFIGAKGAYHFPVNEKLDPYLGASAGYVLVTVSDNAGGFAGAGSGIGYGAYAGARYYFNSKMGLNAELGYTAFSFLSIGASFKF